ncbi:hypothetical protein LOZ61_000258 [Ophidiomyces ophidiicola]|nr:hypothetical protein LOZ61_000258 [Ophidiomyces ophidiicola]KAI2244449.1 hypothetical protein LOZ13_001492 [Ophidiomyces ophidiicola]KAI2402873.1 hypothetical protein LOY90_004860 [Ophidiomyces ophidiicola]
MVNKEPLLVAKHPDTLPLKKPNRHLDSFQKTSQSAAFTEAAVSKGAARRAEDHSVGSFATSQSRSWANGVPEGGHYAEAMKTLRRNRGLITAEIEGLLAEEMAAVNHVPQVKESSDDVSIISNTHRARGENNVRISPESSELFKSIAEDQLGPSKRRTPGLVSKSFTSPATSSSQPIHRDVVQPPTQPRAQRFSKRSARLSAGPSHYIAPHKDLNTLIQRNMERENNLQYQMQNPSEHEFENEFLHLSVGEVNDIREWLQLTGYYDEQYRFKTLQRRRRLAALEQEMTDLRKEDQDERVALLAKHDDAVRPSAYSKQTAIESMARKYSGNASPYLMSGNNESGPRSNKAVVHNDMNDTPSDLNYNPGRKPLMHPTREQNLKRGLSPVPLEDPWKKSRLENWGQSSHTEDQYSSRVSEQPACRKDRRFNSHMGLDSELYLQSNPTDDYAGWNDVQYSRKPKGALQDCGESRMQIRGKGSSKYPGYDIPFRSSYAVGDMVLHATDTRFFMIKCLTAAAVTTSQQDGTWSTQIKNVAKLTEAFTTSRNVILFFSVNQSKAFQGYARMETLPGDEELPINSDSFKGKLSPPFKVMWLNIAFTKFRHAAHLPNSYNEDAPALVGRDGQEIDPGCGLELCYVLDQTPAHKRKSYASLDLVSEP